MIKFNKNTFIGDILCHIYLIILSIIAVFPFIWILLCSVKTNIELTRRMGLDEFHANK